MEISCSCLFSITQHNYLCPPTHQCRVMNEVSICVADCVRAKAHGNYAPITSAALEIGFYTTFKDFLSVESCDLFL